jgi:hypothetical protein
MIANALEKVLVLFSCLFGLLKDKKGQRHSVLIKPSQFTLKVTFYFLKTVKDRVTF